jgi:hypothetical protein
LSRYLQVTVAKWIWFSSVQLQATSVIAMCMYVEQEQGGFRHHQLGCIIVQNFN